jgi:hypothetical protein
VSSQAAISKTSVFTRDFEYCLRSSRQIETFHEILKSGCKAEESKLRTAQRLANLIAVFCILSWRVLWMTMLNQSILRAPPKLVLTPVEMQLLDRLVIDSV